MGGLKKGAMLEHRWITEWELANDKRSTKTSEGDYRCDRSFVTSETDENLQNSSPEA